MLPQHEVFENSGRIIYNHGTTMPPRKIEKLSAVLEKILASRGMGARLREYRVFGQWEKIVGRGIARHARPLALRGRKLSVAVDSSAWMQQLAMLKPEIIGRLNEALGKEAVQSMTLTLGEVGLLPGQTEEPRPAVNLSPEELGRIEDVVKDIKDADIRGALRHLMEMDRANKKRAAK